jgi:two-component system, NarL family, invasion response regulator UvrY
VVLLDISMPGKNGLDIIKQLKSENPGLAILVVSMHPERQYAIRVLKSGASGYMTKDRTPEELINAILMVVSGRKYISPILAQEMASILIEGTENAQGNLSDREYRVLCLIGSGMTNAEIADKLSLSPKTVSTYRTRILQKLGLANDAELIRYALENQLFE